MKVWNVYMATIRDVAKKANVGIGTVSRALNDTGYVAESKRKLIFAAAEELGYTIPEKGVKSDTYREKIIGVVIPDVSLPFYGNFVKYIDIELAKAGYRTMIYNTLGIQGRVADVIDLAERGIIQGIIINSDVNIAELKRLEKLPVVSFERLLGRKIPFVASEHRAGGQLVGQTLYENRCRNVLIITACHQTGVYADYRIEECRKYLEEHSVRVTVAEYPASNISILIAKDIAEKYMELYHDVDGIFSDDIVAYCCLQKARETGISVPEDLKIIGYDGNDIMSLSTPTITTVRQNVTRIAQICVELIQHRIAKEEMKSEYFVPVKFKKGGTTK